MGDMGDIFRGMTKADKERRYKNLEQAQESEWPWTKHTEYHWALIVDGERLDYWPTKNKFRWKGKMYYGGVEGFIRKRARLNPESIQGG
jgi:hypothetical protein